jgi:hypothetical protein
MGQAMELGEISASVMMEMKPMTKAAAAGDGSPWKNLLSTTAVLTLNRAKRKAAQAQ